ncbi:hypothetical protein [Tateyamaria sp. ANG-S1]|uniref:hypothetical protein n=1 Tax=Tateyamaria sp. ANG-S1 TaxID=1577905 RepID=UPI00057C68E5|nr:hypothetical protein [Tateyamaria sp. ANG-S1]KIC50910.1 hypothetical protein RA29_03160 [Tateyamaria sp. ANG-S1]
MFAKAKDPAHHARILERRAARLRRSNWLRRLVFSLTGMGLLLLLRMNPSVVEDVVAMAHDVPPRTQQQSGFEAPQDVHVRRMPTDAVPVRRLGATYPTNTQQIDVQAQANDVAQTLRTLPPGG